MDANERANAETTAEVVLTLCVVAFLLWVAFG